MIGPASQYKQQVGEAIEIGDGEGVDGFVRDGFHREPLGPRAHRTGHVQQTGGLRATGENEALETISKPCLCHSETRSKPSAHPYPTDEHYLRPDALTVQRDRPSIGASVPFSETCPEARDTILGEGDRP